MSALAPAQAETKSGSATTEGEMDTPGRYLTFSCLSLNCCDNGLPLNWTAKHLKAVSGWGPQRLRSYLLFKHPHADSLLE